MSRIRSVKPRLFVSPSMAKVSIPARYLFVGLFTEADDEGRLLDSPKQIAGNLFPHDEAVTARKVKGWLDELAEVGSIERYTEDETSYLCLPTFLEHQRISKATPSILPAPPRATPEFPREIREFPGAAPELPRPEVEVEVEVEVEGITTLPIPAPLKRTGKPVDPLVKASAAAWKAQLNAQGVTMLPQDWSLKACAVVAKALRAGLTPGDLEDAFEWGREQPWFADKLHDPGKLGDLIAQWQQRKVKALAIGNGKPSQHPIDRRVAEIMARRNGG